MLPFAPRLSPTVHAEIERLARRPLAIAEINRRVGRLAWRRRLPKPSYERVRVLVHLARTRRRVRRPRVPRLEARIGIGIGVTLRLGLDRGRDDERRVALAARASPLR